MMGLAFNGNLGGGMKPAWPPDQSRAALWFLCGRGALLVCFWLLMVLVLLFFPGVSGFCFRDGSVW